MLICMHAHADAHTRTLSLLAIFADLCDFADPSFSITVIHKTPLHGTGGIHRDFENVHLDEA